MTFYKSRTFVKILFTVSISSLFGCTLKASLSEMLSTNNGASPPITDITAPLNPFTVKYNNKVDYSNSLNPNIEILGVADIAYYVIAASKTSCENSESWIVYNSDSQMIITSQNTTQSYFLKVKDNNNQIFGCHEMQVTHDNRPPTFTSGIDLETHIGMLGLDKTPTITYSIPSDNLSGVDKVEVKLINFETKSDLTTWTEFTNAGSPITLPSPISNGTFYQVIIKVSDRAGNSKEYINPEAFLGKSQIDVLTEPVSCGATIGGGIPKFIDFDNDGDQDVVVVFINGMGAEEPCFFENQNNRYYSGKVISSFNKMLKNLFVANIDGDDYDDIIAQTNTNEIIIYYGKGHAEFSSAVLKTSTSITIANVFDLNQDGKLDILATIDGSPVFLKQKKAREFEENIMTAPAALGVAKPVKLDADNKTDLYIGNASGKVQFLKNMGDDLNFTLSEVTIAITGETNGLPFDYNGDGFIDVFHSKSSSNTQRISLNDSTGQFSNAPITVQLGTYQEDVAHTIDLNQDGYDDLVTDTSLTVLNNNLGTGFTSTFSAQAWVSGAKKIDFKDTNNDGKIDFVFAGQYYVNDWGLRHFQYFENGGSNNFNLKMSNLFQTNWIAHGVIADLKNNGEKQVLLYDVDSLKIHLLTKQNNIFLQYNSFYVSNLSRTILITDKNNDGIKDFAQMRGSTAADDVNVFNHDGNLNFTASALNETSRKMVLFSGQATTGDSYPDLILGTMSSNKLILYQNLLGTTYSPMTLDTTYTPKAIDTIDYDLDGHPDIITSGSDNNLYLYKNSGTNTYTKSTLLSTPISRNIKTLDLDGNSLFDFVLVEESTSQIVVQYQTSTGVFNKVVVGPTTSVNIINYAFDMCDYDNDSDLDIIAVASNELRVHRNTAGLFGAAEALAYVGKDARTVQCDDVDSDGAKDFLIIDQLKSYIIHP